MEHSYKEVYSQPADIWAFGSLMYEMLELGVPLHITIFLPHRSLVLSARSARLFSTVECILAENTGAHVFE